MKSKIPKVPTLKRLKDKLAPRTTTPPVSQPLAVRNDEDPENEESKSTRTLEASGDYDPQSREAKRPTYSQGEAIPGVNQLPQIAVCMVDDIRHELRSGKMTRHWLDKWQI